MHGDGGAFSKQESLYVFYMEFSVGNVLDEAEIRVHCGEEVGHCARLHRCDIRVVLVPDTDWQSNDLGGGGAYLADRWKGKCVKTGSSTQTFSAFQGGTKPPTCAGIAQRARMMR